MKTVLAAACGFIWGFAITLGVMRNHVRAVYVFSKPEAITIQGNCIAPPPTPTVHSHRAAPSCTHNSLCVGENNGTMTQTNR